MLLAAARVLGECSPALRDPSGLLLPAINDIRRVAHSVAVARAAVDEGLAPNIGAADLKKRVAAQQCTPGYR